jgi:hypothetical protein
MRVRKEIAPPSVANLMNLEPRAYWRTFMSESFPFQMACIYLMFEYVRPQSIYTALDFLPWGLLTLVGGTVASLMNAETRNTSVQGSKLLLLSVFFVHVVITILASRYPSVGFQQLPLLIGWMLAYFLITTAVSNERRMVFFYALFLLFCLKMSQHGFRSWVASGFSFNREGVTGAPGWFRNSGEVGIQMCIFLPTALYFMWAGWRGWSWLKRGLILLLPVTAFGTIIGSSSRGAVIGAGAAFLWMLAKSKYRARGMLGIGFIALVLFLLLPPEFTQRFDSIGQDNSSKLRLEYWAWGWETAKHHPVLGIGYFNWIPVYGDFLRDENIRRVPQVCHNIFIQAVSELGFTGLILVLALIISTFVLNSRTRRLLPDDEAHRTLRLLSQGLDAGMVGFLVSAQFVTVLYYPYFWIALALTVALHNSASKRMRAEALEPSAPPPRYHTDGKSARTQRARRTRREVV